MSLSHRDDVDGVKVHIELAQASYRTVAATVGVSEGSVRNALRPIDTGADADTDEFCAITGPDPPLPSESEPQPRVESEPVTEVEAEVEVEGQWEPSRVARQRLRL